jgi:hypothetical protein
VGQNRESNSEVLGDHTREGKLLKPPLSRLPLEETSWAEQTLPELLWIGLLQKKYGLARGVALSLALADTANQAKANTSSKLWFAATSSYAALEEGEWDRVRRMLRDSGKLDEVARALTPLLYFYPGCPFTQLLTYTPPRPSDEDQALRGLKNLLESLFNKYERDAVLTQATAVYIALATGKLTLAGSTNLENLESVKEFPHTEESRMVAASVRSTCNFLIGMAVEQFDSGWALYFWKRGFEIDSCEYELPYEL